MDEQLKARLIGAAVLVLLAVLLIPELLSSRRPAVDPAVEQKASAGRRSYTIELGDSGRETTGGEQSLPPAEERQKPPDPAPSEQAPAIVAEPAPEPKKSKPEPANTEKVAAVAKKPATPSKPPPAKPAPAPAPQPRAQPPAPSTANSGWSVQVGAFRSAESAEKLARDLKAAGYSAYVLPAGSSGTGLSRVRVGPESDKTKAERLAARLKARGLPVAVVSNR